MPWKLPSLCRISIHNATIDFDNSRRGKRRESNQQTHDANTNCTFHHCKKKKSVKDRVTKAQSLFLHAHIHSHLRPRLLATKSNDCLVLHRLYANFTAVARGVFATRNVSTNQMAKFVLCEY